MKIYPSGSLVLMDTDTQDELVIADCGTDDRIPISEQRANAALIADILSRGPDWKTTSEHEVRSCLSRLLAWAKDMDYRSETTTDETKVLLIECEEALK